MCYSTQYTDVRLRLNGWKSYMIEDTENQEISTLQMWIVVLLFTKRYLQPVDMNKTVETNKIGIFANLIFDRSKHFLSKVNPHMCSSFFHEIAYFPSFFVFIELRVQPFVNVSIEFSLHLTR